MDLIKESIVRESPDVTSIINAFEANKNPLELFFNENFGSMRNFEDKLNIIDGKLNDLNEWLTNCYPHMRPQLTDYKRCIIKFSEIENKINHLNSIFVKPLNRFNIVTCAKCDTQFNLNNSDDVDHLQNHKHAVDILSKKYENTPIITTKYDFSIQLISNIKKQFRCLLCQIFVNGQRNTRSHYRSKQHAKNCNDRDNFESVHSFLENFQQLPHSIQIFQVLFEPSPQTISSNLAFCIICDEYVVIERIPEHVTSSQTHKTKFQTVDYSHLNGYKEMLDIMSITGAPSTSAHLAGKSPNKKKINKHTIVVAYPYIVNNKCDKFVSVSDFIPHRLRHHEKFIMDNVKQPFCTLCKFQIKHTQLIVAHLITDEHKLKCRPDVAIIKYLYYCCLCCKYYNNEHKWMEHMTSVAHKQKELLMPKQQIPLFKEYECNDCSFVWYGQPHTVAAHKKNKFGLGDKHRKQKEVTLPNELIKLLKDSSAFAADILKSSKESEDVLNSIESAHKCCRAIEQALSAIFGEDIRAYPFGSRVSGLGNIASDLDVFVDIGSMYDGTKNQNAQCQSYYVQQSAAALRKHKDFTDICPIPQARTPIVQVFHKITDLDCDLSFRHGLSIENTKFLKFCIDIQPKLKSLILFLKKWIRWNKLRERISTYGISLMSIYMMQKKGYLPTLAKLREIDPSSKKSKIIAGWETFNFEKPVSELTTLYPVYAQSERHLLAEFFDFYIKFDYENEVICPLLGESVAKHNFQDATNDELLLPKEMINYVKKIKENVDHEKIKITKSICIQDPFDLSHNVTKAFPIEILSKMIKLMEKSHQLLLLHK